MERQLFLEIREIMLIIKDKIMERAIPRGWIDIEDASFYCSLSKSTIRRAVTKGSLKCSRRSGKLLFKISELDRWLNEEQY